MGQPLNILSGSDIADNGEGGSQRVSYNGGPIYAPSQSIAQWFDKNSFYVPAAGTFGNLGYDTARGPHYVDFDMAFAKAIPVWHEHQIKFRADMFNIFNHGNMGNPNVTWNSPLFGEITSEVSPRVIQLSLRYSF